MKFAIIVRGPGYINLFYRIGDFLKEKGIDIVYVMENKYEIFKEGYQDILANEKVYYLIDFKEESLQQQDQQNFDWLALFSTYDRVNAYHYNVEPKELEEMLAAAYNMWEYLFTEEHIDGVIYEGVSNVISYVAYIKCNEYKKKYVAIVTSRLPGRVHIFNDLYGTDDIYNNFQSFLKKKINIYNDKEIVDLYNHINQPQVAPDYMKNNPGNINYSLIKHYCAKISLIGRYTSYCLREHKNIKRSFTMKNPFEVAWKLLERNIKRKITFRLMDTLGYFKEPDYSEKFLVYSLHFHPEASTSLNAWPFVDELPIIKNTAFSLPHGYKLYVKPHPNGVGYEGIQFYKTIKKIPRVKLISPLINSKELIPKSCGVVTLAGTMGFEALMLRKPVFTFGQVFYQVHPYCYKITNLYKFPETLKTALNSNYNPQVFEYYNFLLLKSYYKCTFPGHFDTSIHQSDENIKNLGAAILNNIINNICGEEW